LELFIHSSDKEHPDVVEVEPTVLVRSLLVASDPDCHVWMEDVDAAIDLDITLAEAGIGNHGHVHRGRCGRVEVVVRFNGNYERTFGPGTTIRTIHQWACGPDAANLSKEQAATHVLAVPGADHFLDDGVHIGSLVEPHSCTVTLDLLPRSRFEG